MLLLFSYVSAMFGILAIYILGAVTTWRIAASVALLVPTVTAFALLFVSARLIFNIYIHNSFS